LPKVHLLWFVQQDDELLIGVSETESDANNAIERLKSKPGFLDFPQAFEIHFVRIRKRSLDRRFYKRLKSRTND